MKIQIEASLLQKKLTYLNHGISSRAQLPILSHSLLEAKNDSLTLSSTDLEIGIQTSLPAIIEEEGDITIPARTFSELIGSLNGKTAVQLTLTDSVLTVSSAHTKSVFQTLPRDEFPKLFEEMGTEIASMTQDDLQKNFTSVIFAASTETTRPALSGVLVKKEGQGLLLVATDGYRLSLKHHVSKSGSVGDIDSFIIPARVFRELLAVKDEGESILMRVAKENNQVLFQIGSTILVGRLIEAEFPNFEKIIPTDSSSQITFDREELLHAVKICSIFARETANIIKFSLRSDRLIVSSQTPSLGENTVEVEAKLTGEENEIAFNARYLQDALSQIDVQELVFEMTGPLNPGVFKVKEDQSFLHLIMPIRIQQ